MSAWVVTDNTITGMLEACNLPIAQNIRAHDTRISYLWGEWKKINSPREAGQKLLDQNFRSVRARYGNDADEMWPPRTYRILSHVPVTPVQIIKLCDCYSYQACETDDWEQTEAYAIVMALRERAIRNLPGYAEAPWGID